MKVPAAALSLYALLAGALFSAVNVPSVGTARFADGTVRSVFGLPSNLVISNQALGSADAASFSGEGGLISRAGRIRLLGADSSVIAQYDSAEAQPVLNIDGALTTAVFWLPSRHLLVRWNGNSFDETSVDDAVLPGQVTSVRVAGSGTATLIATDSHADAYKVSISLETGNVVSIDVLPGVHGPAFQQQDFILFHDGRYLHVVSPSGTVVQSLPLTAQDIVFERMSSNALHLVSPASNQDWVLHFSGSRASISALPAPPAVRRTAAIAIAQEEQK
jgi:hypothetical protein